MNLYFHKPARRISVVFVAWLVFAGSTRVVAQELHLESVESRIDHVADVSLTLSSGVPTQGLTAVCEWDDAVAVGADLVPDASMQGADMIAVRVESGYAIISLVTDFDGHPDRAIPAGENTPIAALTLQCANSPGTTAISFVDDAHALMDEGPPLRNEVVVDGLAIGVADGLVLTDGRLECGDLANRFYFSEGSIMGDWVVDVPVWMENPNPVEGFVVSLCHSAERIVLEDIRLGDATAALDPDFVDRLIEDGGGYAAVILDTVAPPGEKVIPRGEAHPIATFAYSCFALACSDEAAESPIEFCDGRWGDPPQANAIHAGGAIITVDDGLLLEGTHIACFPECPPPKEICDDGMDNDGDGLIDLEDPDCDDFPMDFFWQVPGDCNQDRRLDLSDSVCVFGALFLGDPPAFPCGDGSPDDPANVALLDWQLDGRVDISDQRLHRNLLPGSPL